MAKVRLNILAAETCKLPHVCLCCGAPSTTGETHKVYYDPTWLATIGILLPGRIPYYVASQSLAFPVPVCSRHTWRLKLPTYLGYAFALILFPLGPLAVLAHIGELPLARDIMLTGLALFVPVGLLVLWGVRLFSPRMVDYDSRSALLVNVARGFAEAVEGRKLPGLPGKLPSGQVLPGQAHTGTKPNWILIGAVFGGCAVLMMGCVGMMLVAGAIGRAGRAQQLAQAEERFKQMRADADARRDQFL